MRYERKYRVSASFDEVRHVVQQHPALFSKVYPDRFVNSLYFDTLYWEALHENLNGISHRIKYRIRWYGEDLHFAKKPTLEKKIKLNQLGDKEHFPLPDFQLNQHTNYRALLQKAGIKKQLKPVVLVQYLRSYYLSKDGEVRLTIDRKLQYFLFNGMIFFAHSPQKDEAIIVELKYEADYQKIDEVVQKLPFRLAKNSKFVSAVFQNYF